MEYGIPFSDPMVLAIQDDRKTQTRRVISPQPRADLGYMRVDGGALQCGADYPDGDKDFVRCRYGSPGDLLYVRQAWRATWEGCDSDALLVNYRAGDLVETIDGARGKVRHSLCNWKWQPPMFHPKALTRLWLKVEAVRVQRVQDITEADAVAEGFSRHTYRDGRGEESARWDFRETWDKLNKARGFAWASNPWVWAVTFSRAERPCEP